MKKKYTLTVANSQINIQTEAPKEEIDAIVGIVDRRIREIHLYSKTCSRTDAAILLCLDYCAEKMELQKTVRAFSDQVEHLSIMNENSQKQIASLEREIEVLRATLELRPTRVFAKPQVDEQIAFDEITEQIPETVTEEKKPPRTALHTLLNDESLEEAVKEAPAPAPAPAANEEHNKPHAKARKKKVRAMFDMISFDDI